MNKKDLTHAGASIFRKTIIVLSGLILSLVLLEAGLRLGGFVLLSIQEYGNSRSIKQKGAYRILCIGESTTQGQYPHLLEQVLNQRNIGVRFSVIDKGRGGKRSGILLEEIEPNLAEYRPDMVVAMMGINDVDVRYYQNIPDSESWLFKHCRIYRFGRILWMHILKKLKHEDIFGFERAATGKKAILAQAKVYQPDEDKESPGKAQPPAPKTGLNETFPGPVSTEGLAEKVPGIPVTPIQIDRHADNNPNPGKVHAPAPQTSPNGTSAGSVPTGGSVEPPPVTLAAQTRVSQPDEAQTSVLQNGLKETSAGLVKKALELDPDNDKAYVFPQVDALMKRAIDLDPNNDKAYFELAKVYQERRDKSLQAGALFEKAFELNPSSEHGVMLARYYRLLLGQPQRAEDLLKKIIQSDPTSAFAYYELGWLYRLQGKWPQAEAALQRSMLLDPEKTCDVRVIGALLLLYEEMGKPELAKEYAEKAHRLRANPSTYGPIAVDNYHKLKEILDKRGVRLVCVQYPMRDVRQLKAIFKKDEDVIFVDNEYLFKNAVKKNGFKEYFRDVFAGDFGHCTPKGNMLLAENIAEVILKEVFNR